MPSIKIKRRKTRRRKKRLYQRKWVKITLALSLLPVIAVGAFLIRYYYIFDATIEAKLGKRLSLSATKFYAAPVVLHPGKKTNMEALASRLRRIGYEEDTGVSPLLDFQ